jgi:hypothetical protein
VVERVVGVASPDPGDRALIPQDRVDPPRVAALAEERGRLLGQRLRSEGCERAFVASSERPHARLALLPELLDEQRRPLGESETCHRAPRLRRLRRGLDIEPTPLREVHEHPITALVVEDQELSSPPHGLEAPSDELGGPRHHRLQRRELQEVEALERGAPDRLAHALGQRLDLGHLWHVSSSRRRG